MNRRGFLKAILASATAPYVVTAAGVLMPVKKIITGPEVWFTQSGTGVNRRTVQDALREWHNVRDYGAVGDGITDDSEAFNNAILAASYTTGKVYIPGGDYRYAALTLPGRDGGWDIKFDAMNIPRLLSWR